MTFSFRLKQIVRRVARWLSDQRGSLGVTMAVATPVVVMLVGVSFDYARAENVRSKLQRATDMASLALSKLTDNYDNPTDAAQRFIRAMLEGEGVDASSMRVGAKVDKTLNSKSATVSASLDTDLFFAGFFTADEFTVAVSSSAAERYRHMEISLVLDISGSMGSNSKIRRLKEAATEFLQIMLKSDTDAEFTTLNIIPYGGDVMLGEPFDKFLKPLWRLTPWNGCIDLGKEPLHGQVLSIGTYNPTPAINFGSQWVCPQSWNRTLFRENDLDTLVDHVEGLRALGPSTSTDVGAHWGLAALLPDWRPHLPGNVTEAPREMNGEVTKKLIIMTDGAINGPHRLFGTKVKTLYDSLFASNRLRGVCDAAKDSGVEVFTIGFEVNSHWMLDLLKDCATSSKHYFDPSGTQISDVFKSIAFRLAPLRLTQ